MRKVLLLFFAALFIFTARNAALERTDLSTEYTLMSVLWVQTSAEYKALCLQAFNSARDRLTEYINTPRDKSLKPAVITDIDETVLDNSPYQGWVLKNNRNYPAGWDEWCKRSEARPVPGALEFIKFAEKNGIEVFYVTNRKKHLYDCTLKNLKDLGFPFADKEHIFLREGSSDKEYTRQKIALMYDIVLLIGDNLNDFSNIFFNKGIGERSEATDENGSLFGKKFIILPNPMYGDWESALFWDKGRLSETEKQGIRLDSYRAF